MAAVAAGAALTADDLFIKLYMYVVQLRGAGSDMGDSTTTEEEEEAKQLVIMNRDVVNLEVAEGHSLLHEAARSGGPEMVLWLLSHGADMNAKDSNEKTPLQICSDPDTLLQFQKWAAVYGTDPIAPALDGQVVAACQVCFSSGHVGFGEDDFIRAPCGHFIHTTCFKRQVLEMLKDTTGVLENKLVCPYTIFPGGGNAAEWKHCKFPLNSIECMAYYKHSLDAADFDELQTRLTVEAKFTAKCPGCGNGVFMSPDPSDVHFRNLVCTCSHEFCGKCTNGPHEGMTCREAAAAQQPKDVAPEVVEFVKRFKKGWVKPCPQQCAFLGGAKGEGECNHVTCLCGHEFCWDCGADRRVIVAHDLRWHKPSCNFYQDPRSVSEAPKRSSDCPACREIPGDGVCSFPVNDGWPEACIPVVPEACLSVVPAQHADGAPEGLCGSPHFEQLCQLVQQGDFQLLWLGMLRYLEQLYQLVQKGDFQRLWLDILQYLEQLREMVALGHLHDVWLGMLRYLEQLYPMIQEGVLQIDVRQLHQEGTLQLIWLGICLMITFLNFFVL